jgi:hypothetical protein
MPIKYHGPSLSKTTVVRMSTNPNNKNPTELKQSSGKKVSRLGVGSRKAFKAAKQAAAIRKGH